MAPTKHATKKHAQKRPRKAAPRAAAKATRPRVKPTTRSARDAIAVLKEDHREVERLFKRFEKAGDSAYRTKEQLVSAMIEALSRHAAIEELVFYPAVKARTPRLESRVSESLEEHHLAKVVLSELEDLDAKSPRFDAKVRVMIEVVRHHVKEEEHSLFPTVRERIPRRELLELGEALQAGKRHAPTRPHPNAPDEPPGNALVGGAVAVIDRARTTGKRAVERARDEVPGL